MELSESAKHSYTRSVSPGSPLPRPFSSNNMKNPAKPSPTPITAGSNGSSFASEVNKLHQKQSSCHFKALVATLVLGAGISAGLILYQNGSFPLAGSLGLIAIAYFFYLVIGCCCNSLNTYLQNVENGQNFEKKYEWIRNGVGFFQFRAEGYHYETRSNTRTITNANGTTSIEHYTTTEKVVSYTAQQRLNPISTVDESGPIDQIRANTSLVFIRFLLQHRFSDAQSQCNFDIFFEGFKRRHTRDVHQGFSYNYVLPGLVERKAYFVGESSCNYQAGLWAFAVLGLLWPYCMFVESKITRFDVISTKVLAL